MKIKVELSPVEIKEGEGEERTNSFLQTRFWCNFKSASGWSYKKFSVKSTRGEKVKEGSFYVLSRIFASNLFSLAYIPLLPLSLFCLDIEEEEEENSSEVEDKAEEIKAVLLGLGEGLKRYLAKNTVCIKVDCDKSFTSTARRDAYRRAISKVKVDFNLKVYKNKVDIQPPDSSAVDLTLTTEEILNRMKSKWRYNIRLAKKKGVVIEKVGGEDKDLESKLEIFYKIYQETAARDGIALHKKEYYKSLLTSAGKEKKAVVALYLARHESDYLAGIITLCTQEESVYLYGASSSIKREYMPNFLLQWTAMKEAKDYGCKYYDLYGLPPNEDEKHPMHGLYLFKKGFGGSDIHRLGTYDIRLKKVYSLLSVAERLRAFYHKRILKRVRGR